MYEWRIFKLNNLRFEKKAPLSIIPSLSICQSRETAWGLHLGKTGKLQLVLTNILPPMLTISNANIEWNIGMHAHTQIHPSQAQIRGQYK